MAALLFYIFKSTLCLIILYVLFRLFFRKDTLFRTNRVLLLVGTVASILLPLVQIGVSQYTPLQLPIIAIQNLLTEKAADSNMTEAIYKEFPIEEISTPVAENRTITDYQDHEASGISITLLLGSLYFVGAIAIFVFFLLSTFRMFRLISRYPACKYGKFKLIICPEEIVSFSWGNVIILSKDDYERNPEEVLLHEQMHLQHRHTLDLLWMECITIIHWFNPVVWLLMRELREVHEYEADNGVINYGIDATQYQLLLVKKTVGTRLYSMACGFNHSKLKNRITMMLKRRTNSWARLKLLLFVPVAAGTLYAFAQPEVKMVGQAIKSVSVKQDSIQWSELEKLQAYFKRKSEDASQGMKQYTIKGKAFGNTNYLFINMNNKMMLNQKMVDDAETLSARLIDLWNKGYDEAVKTDRKFINNMYVKYDRGSSSDAIASYLRAIKESYQQVRERISEQLGNVSEAQLDSIFPILVLLDSSENVAPKYRTASDVVLPIEITLLPEGGTSMILKNFSLRELEMKLQACKENIGNQFVVSLKSDKDVTIGEIEDTKRVIKNTLYGKE